MKSSTYSAIGKRWFDFGLAIAMLAPAAVIGVFLLLAIRLGDPGPAIFKQIRVGRRQRPFVLYKFRTMSVHTGDRPSHEVSRDKVTRLGRFLRATKIDELPQLINIVRGDMSFVGPRPCLPSQTTLIAEREKRGLYSIRPGVTGPAQIRGIDMSTPERLAEADGKYLGQITLLNDIKYLIKTGTGQGRGDAVR